MNLSELDWACCEPVNHLWPQLVERLGLERSAIAVRQALDLQAMRSQPGLLPVLLVETCGVALVERSQLRAATGLPLPEGPGLLVLLSRQRQQLQLLQLS